MPESIEIKQISVHCIWLLALLEMITVPLVILIPQITNSELKNPFHGIVVGIIGIIILFYFLNKILKRLHIPLGNSRVEGISILTSALWSGSILAGIFFIQELLKDVVNIPYPAREIIVGFFSVCGSIFICGTLYRGARRYFPSLSICMKTEKGIYFLHAIPILKTSLLAGVYEAVALPIIVIWMSYPEHQILAGAITGSLGGCIGGSILWFIIYLTEIRLWVSVQEARSV